MSKRCQDTDNNADPASAGTKKRKHHRGSHPAELTHGDFTVGWLCALPKEQTAAVAMLDRIHLELPKPLDDPNTYTLGSIDRHNIVIACLPKGKIGTSAAATFATQMVRTFPSIKIVLVVGIGGGIPPKVRLGDVVVGTPTGQYPGVVQWDLGKAEKDGEFKRTGALNNPPSALLTQLATLETKHDLYGSKIPQYLDTLKEKWPRLVPKYVWSESRKDPLSASDASDRSPDDVRVHYGLIASGNQVIKDADFRDRLNERLGGDVLCVEMEAAGLMDFPCIVIRGICDYADSQKNNDWQEYAAAVAAAFAKELLQNLQPSVVDGVCPVKDMLNTLEQVHDDIYATREYVTQIKSYLVRKEDLEICDWLSPIDYGPQQSDYLARRQPGTGQWLLASTEFQSWLNTSKQTLFCPGIPRARKTILTSVVIDGLDSRFRNNARIGVAYVYCNFLRQNEQSLDQLLANILKQLTLSRPSLPDNVQNLYNQHKTKRTRPSLDEVIAHLHSVAAMYSRVFIIVDALDECQAPHRCRARFLSELFNIQTRHGANIFATSRPIPEIAEHFKAGVSLEIRATTDDVTRYLEHHIGTLPSIVQTDRQLQEEIITGISEAVDGMFLLAQLYIGLLHDKLTANDIRSAMETFRKQGQRSGGGRKDRDLDLAYKQTMERINGQMPGMKELAMKVLSWVTCAKRQLTTSELQHALATKTGTSKIDQGDLPHIEDMVSVCAGLVTIDEESRVMCLAHYTTQEYLMKTKEQWFPRSESAITTTCVAYLSFAAFETGVCTTDREFEARLQSNPLYDYAAHYWGCHARDDVELSQETINFLENTAKVEASGQVLMTDRRFLYDGYSQGARGRMTGLHLAAYFGVNRVTCALLRRGHTPNARDTGHPTPLWYAAGKGHVDIVKLLLAAGAHVNTDNNYRADGTALKAASKGGHLDIVETLLAAGANVNDSPIGSWTPLHLAAERGHLDIVETLLAAGANVNNPPTRFCGWTALEVAAKEGHLPIVERLLAAGAKVNTATSIVLSTALQVAALGGHLGVVERLLAAGAEVNATSIGGQNALKAAAERGHLYVVERLLAAGANVNFHGPGASALQIAARGGYLKIVERLLAAGADVNAAAGFFTRTALEEAIIGGHAAVVNRLKAAGALR